MLLPLTWLLLFWGATPSIDPVQLEEHLDEIVPSRLEQTGVPGVVISVVEGDRVLCAKGWGLADRERGTPMDGEQTVVRVASISKTFTATAVAQLESQGRLSVDTPVAEVLGGMAPSGPWGAEVTLRHLLSHSAGLINNNVGRVSLAPPVLSMRAFIERTMPPVVRPPGVAVVYSNHGNALAGLVVEERSGQPFAEYIEQHVLVPLRMDDSSYEPKPELLERLATSYAVEDGELRPYEYLYFKTLPASTVHTTAADMANFMVMHLQGGEFEGKTVLPDDAHQRMRTPVPAIHPALPTYHYAFAHSHTAGHPTRSHGGSIPAFLSRMVLFDEHQVGVFVAQNGFEPSLTGELVTSIAQRFLPEPTIPSLSPNPESNGSSSVGLGSLAVAGDGRPEHPGRIVGDYRRLGKGDTPAFVRWFTQVWPEPLRVELDEEGFVQVGGKRFVRTGPMVFHRAREGRWPEALVFIADDTGVVRWVHRGMSSAERPRWHATRRVQLLWLGLMLSVLVIVAAKRWRMSLRAQMGVAAARMTLFALVVSHLYVVWVDAGQVAYLRPLRFGIPWWLDGLLLVPWLAFVVALFGLVGVRAERDEPRRAWIAVFLATVAIGALLAWQWYWRIPQGLVQL